MNKLAVGIDIGGTNTKFGIVDNEGNVIIQSRIKTSDFKDFKKFVITIKEKLLELHPISDIVGVGIGAPNGNFFEGTVVDAPNLPWHGTTHLAKEFETIFNTKCVLTNDANAAAIGEKIYGRAKELDDFVVLTVGTGLGSGIFINGNILYGKHGFAGELGHTLVNVNGRYCACGLRGCLETYVSATGIRRTVYKLLADYTDPSILRSISFNDLSTKTITEAAEKSDKIAIEAFNYTGRILGMKLADFVLHTDPAAIFIMGGLSKAGKHLFEPAQESMEKYMMPMFRKNGIQLKPSGLKDDDSPILGASSLVWKYIDSNN